MNINESIFGSLKNNNDIFLYTLKNTSGTEIKITNFGGIITAIKVKDRNDKLRDIVLGFNTFEAYLREHPYFGALIGRYANRIAKAEFQLNGEIFRLFANDGMNHEHGGKKGFDKVIWNSKILSNTLELSYSSQDREEGYPGNLKVKVQYTLTEENELVIEYDAISDRDTFINLTSHSYFNLSGEGTKDILNHELQLNARYFLPIDSESIPTGELRHVKDTVFDFINSIPIGARIETPDEQLHLAGGYDHNFIINNSEQNLKKAGTLKSPDSGIGLAVFTTEPGIQVYTGNYLDGTLKGKSGVYAYRSGICLETQHYPDSPHFPEFPSTLLKQGKIFKSMTKYSFFNV